MLDGFWARAAINSGIVVVGVAALCLLLALPSAWLLERTDLAAKRFLERVFPLAYALPSYLMAIAWILLANPRVGWLNLLARRFFDIETLVNIYHLGGVIFVEASVLFTILFFSLRSGLRQLDPSLEEAARLAGASGAQVFRRITLPLIRGHLAAGLLAVALASLASFGVPAMIASPARRFVLTTAIYSRLQEGSSAAFGQALWVALEMAALTLALVILGSWWRRPQNALVGGKARRPAAVELGAWRRPLAACMLALWSILVALPLVALVLSSFLREPGQLRLDNFSLRAWHYVLFSLDEFHRALRNSLLTAGLAAGLVVLLALGVAIAQWRGALQQRRWLGIGGRLVEHAGLLTYSLPGTVLALLLIVLLGRGRLADTLALLVLAYGVKFLTLGIQTLRPSALAIDRSLIESAQLAGARFGQRLWRIWIPLLRGPMAAALLLVFMPCFSELTMSILLHGPGTETLGVVLFNLQEYADRSSAAVVGTLLLLVILAFRSLATRLLPES